MPTAISPATILTTETVVAAVADAMANPTRENRFLVRLDNGSYHLVGRWDAEMTLRPFAWLPESGSGLEIDLSDDDLAACTVEDADGKHADYQRWSQDAREAAIRRTMRWIADRSPEELADLRLTTGGSLYGSY